MLGRERLVSVIELTIQREYFQNDWTVFWPSQFVTETASEQAVLEALHALVGLGRLRDEVVLHCPDGTPVFKGRPQEADQWLKRGACPYCTPDPDEEHGIELRFTMA